jgi:hypothetical protein
MMSGGVEQVIVNRPNLCHSLTWRVSAVVQSEQSASGGKGEKQGRIAVGVSIPLETDWRFNGTQSLEGVVQSDVKRSRL